jgi:hypothetical protein
LVGCAAQNTVKEARLVFDQAKDAGAERSAPYPYFAAQGYLELAEDENAEVDLKAARMYAEKSLAFSNQAMGR